MRKWSTVEHSPSHLKFLSFIEPQSSPEKQHSPTTGINAINKINKQINEVNTTNDPEPHKGRIQ